MHSKRDAHPVARPYLPRSQPIRGGDVRVGVLRQRHPLGALDWEDKRLCFVAVDDFGSGLVVRDLGPCGFCFDVTFCEKSLSHSDVFKTSCLYE